MQNYVRTAEDVKMFLESEDSFWHWDNHKYLAQLTSGKLSDFFANCSPIYTVPEIQDGVGSMLSTLIPHEYRKGNLWVMGSAMGSIGLAQSLALHIGCRAAFTEPEEGKMVLKRFDLGRDPEIILVEDVVTTGSTTQKTIWGVIEKHPDSTFCSIVPAVVDRRVNKEKVIFDPGGEYEITGLINVEPRIWNSVEELPEEMKKCMPVRPKGNWDKLKEKW